MNKTQVRNVTRIQTDIEIPKDKYDYMKDYSSWGKNKIARDYEELPLPLFSIGDTAIYSDNKNEKVFIYKCETKVIVIGVVTDSFGNYQPSIMVKNLNLKLIKKGEIVHYEEEYENEQ